MNATTNATAGESRIYNLIILDESGSMHVIYEQALSGANETLQTIRQAQRENPDDHQMVSFVTFHSSVINTVIFCDAVENVQDITPDQYRPGGSTPLYDAMGDSITEMKKAVREGDHVLVTVITDGYENSSRRYSAARIKEMVDTLSEQDWVFTYIGANQNSERTAADLGIRSTMDFKATAAGSSMMWQKMQSSRREYYKKVRQSKESGVQFDFNDDFFAQKQALTRVTPSRITELAPGEVFVFGSNLSGHHDGGAARIALERFGAVYGQGVGLQGRSYAIPTMMQGINEIARHVNAFIEFADRHPEMRFLVTRVGCGIAGYTDEDIAPHFARAYSLPNVFLPAEFWKVLSYRYGR